MKKVNNYPGFKEKRSYSLWKLTPVALTSIVCKLMGSILRNDKMSFLLAHGLLTKNQHGFLAKH